MRRLIDAKTAKLIKKALAIVTAGLWLVFGICLLYAWLATL